MLDVLNALTLSHKMIVIGTTCLVTIMVYLMYRIIRPKRLSQILPEPEKLEERVSEYRVFKKERREVEPFEDVISFKRKTHRYSGIEERSREDLTTRVIDGVTIYGRFPPSEAEIRRRAQFLSKESAWGQFRDTFWKARYKGIQRFYPEIYREIMCWREYPYEYCVYIGMKWLLDIPFVDGDLWV